MKIFDQCTRHIDLLFYPRKGSNFFDTNAFIDYINHVILPHTNEKNAVLLLDSAKIHHKEEVVTLLRQHNISIITIPPNMTDLYQPLDVKIIGPVKSSTHAALTRLRRNSKTHVVNYTHTIEQFYRAYQRIPRQTIVSAFKQGANI